MENTDFDWLNGNRASNLEFPISDSPRAGTAAEPASQAAERVDQTGSERALQLLAQSASPFSFKKIVSTDHLVHFLRWQGTSPLSSRVLRSTFPGQPPLKVVI